MYEDNPAPEDASGPRLLRVRNASGQKVPPFAACLVTGYVPADDVYLVTQPTEAGQTEGIVFNGPSPLGTGATDGTGGYSGSGSGSGSGPSEGYATNQFPLIALCQHVPLGSGSGSGSGSGTGQSGINPGDSLGTQANSWLLVRGGTGFRAVGVALADGVDGDYVQVIPDPLSGVEIGQPDPDAGSGSGSGGCPYQAYRIVGWDVLNCQSVLGEQVLFIDMNSVP